MGFMMGLEGCRGNPRTLLFCLIPRACFTFFLGRGGESVGPLVFVCLLFLLFFPFLLFV